jgi:hypothetical protein
MKCLKINTSSYTGSIDTVLNQVLYVVLESYAYNPKNYATPPINTGILHIVSTAGVGCAAL